jgi:hypothetical protein
LRKTKCSGRKHGARSSYESRRAHWFSPLKCRSRANLGTGGPVPGTISQWVPSREETAKKAAPTGAAEGIQSAVQLDLFPDSTTFAAANTGLHSNVNVVLFSFRYHPFD